MSNHSSITALLLEGFQVFEKSTLIPLERLTLMFGPNSAGKSAVQDALELYASLLENSAGSSTLNDGIKRHWRRMSNTENSLAESMSIGVYHDIKSRRVDSGMNGEFESMQYLTGAIFKMALDREISNTDWSEAAKCSSIFKSIFVFKREVPIGKSFLSYSLNYSLSNSNQKLIDWSNNYFSISLDHPLLVPHRSKINFDAIARAFPDEVSYQDGVFVIKNGLISFPINGKAFIEMRENWLIPNNRWAPDSNWSDPLLQSAIAEISLITGSLLSALHYTLGFKPLKVDASRKVPTRGDLSFRFSSLDDHLPYSVSEGDSQYWPLAESLCSSLLSRGNPEGSLENKKQLSRGVSRAFTDHLFLEQGYRLDFDYRILLSKKNSKAAILGEKLDSNEFDFFTEIFLRDNLDRKHAVEDVGSGIGYILPVLCNLYGEATETTGFLQQPELHLHPALQAALGDVFIESVNSNKQVLIETHSEHLLLRLLKRIRQTHLQVDISPELKINAEDVCVLYFDPGPDGTTIVKRLRITQDGEFMDRWPRGFFGERDMELFDE